MMQFGLFGGARTSRTGPQADTTGYGDFIAYVKQAERLGFGHVFLVEHHFTGYGQLSATLTLLSYLAACTTRIRLGTAVTVLPWHNPVLLAEQVATLDLLSNGRFDFGIGRGYREQEFSGFCIPMNEAADRFDEAIEVIRTLLSNPRRCNSHIHRSGWALAAKPPFVGPHAKVTTYCLIRSRRSTSLSNALRFFARNAGASDGHIIR
jgi:alkanesulfonate monooxygenase SsuD/methylene tetrahydromethanopterin reductase-like flavin-dependent oxidoreductase (luciferase family)